MTLTKILLNQEDIIHVIWRDITEKKILVEKLIESEKIASLGSLVAGVAHEINTPIGIGLTGITHFLDMSKKIKKDYEEENISQVEFERFLKDSNELAVLINLNLSKTAQLIKSFKQVSVDQISEEKRVFNVKKYIEEILLSLKNITKKIDLYIEVNCDNELEINSYPGAFSQILTNLVINSIKHGFDVIKEGTIFIDITKKDNTLKMIYKDTGSGISKENLPKVFEPFFTTKRSSGGTGLGLNIVFNIVRSQLGGTLTCKSENEEGTEFIITMNLNHS